MVNFRSQKNIYFRKLFLQNVYYQNILVLRDDQFEYFGNITLLELVHPQ